MKTDYIIVGCGLAGIAFCEELKANNKAFFVFDNESQKSSLVAGGLYNPVILNRFTKVWRSREQLDLALPKYKLLEKKLNNRLDYKTTIHRLFHYEKEQKTWLKALKKTELTEFMSVDFKPNTNQLINAPLGFGEVLHTGRIDTKLLVSNYRAQLKKEGLFSTESFVYNELKHHENSVTYKDIEAKHIVFAEGYGLTENPFFKHLPLSGLKGEYITIKAPDLKLKEIIKSSVFIIPLGNHLYRIGATFEKIEKTNTITESRKIELLEKLAKFITVDFEVINHTAGIRPTVIDHKPLVGQHETHKNYYVLNGLGARGVMIAPYASKALFNAIENNIALDSEIDISRFNN
jgi:glycine/D-amino acid oxidase-like deaminating enzyme